MKILKSYNDYGALSVGGADPALNEAKAADNERGKNKKRGSRKVNLKKLLGNICIFVFVIYFIYTIIWQQIDLHNKQGEVEELNEQITIASQETERLQQELGEVSDPDYLERMAREKLGLVEPNERVFIDANSDSGR